MPARGGLDGGLTYDGIVLLFQAIRAGSGLPDCVGISGRFGRGVTMAGSEFCKLPNHIESIKHQLHNIDFLAAHSDHRGNDLLLR